MSKDRKRTNSYYTPLVWCYILCIPMVFKEVNLQGRVHAIEAEQLHGDAAEAEQLRLIV